MKPSGNDFILAKAHKTSKIGRRCNNAFWIIMWRVWSIQAIYIYVLQDYAQKHNKTEIKHHFY